MKKDILREREKQWADTEKEMAKEMEINPLSQYSTTQLKKELRRRKQAQEMWARYQDHRVGGGG